MKFRRGFLCFLSLAALAACSPGPAFFCDWRACMFLPSCRSLELFTDEYRVRLEPRLSRVQFYLSRNLVLTREMEIIEDAIDAPSHRVRVEKDRRVLEIEIPAGTPGVLREATEDVLWVAFEDLGDVARRRLPFRRTPIRAGDADRDDPANFVYQFDEPEVRYEGTRFAVRFEREGVRVTPSDVSVYAPASERTPGVHRIRKTFYPALMIDLFEREDFRRTRRTADGVRVED